MEKVLIYPYDIESYVLVKYSHLLVNLQISKVVSLQGWGYVGSYINIGKDVLEIGADFEEAMEECSVVWFVKSKREIDFEKFIFPLYKKAVLRNKKIIFTCEVEEASKKQILLLAGNKNVYFPNSAYNIEEQIIFHSEIDVPIVLVAGTTPYTDKFNTQLVLYNNLKKLGYKVLLIGTKEYTQFFGGQIFPEFLFENNIESSQKVILLNNYVNNMVEHVKPDIVIAGVPGGIIPVTEHIPIDYGVLGFQMGQALRPDCIVLNLMANNYSKGEIDDIGKEAIRILNSNKVFYTVTDKLIDLKDTEKNKMIQYVSLDESYVLQKIKDYDEKVFFHGSKNNMEQLVEYIINYLAEDIEIQII